MASAREAARTPPSARAGFVSELLARAIVVLSWDSVEEISAPAFRVAGT